MPADAKGESRINQWLLLHATGLVIVLLLCGTAVYHHCELSHFKKRLFELERPEAQKLKRSVEWSLSRSGRQTTDDSLDSFIESLVRQQVSVLHQYCGDSSKICLPGAKGDQGVTGITGPRGEPGAQGKRGDRGDTGSPGLAGSKGDTGATGASGTPGTKGEPGTQGPKGDVGTPGQSGPPGEKGDRGEKGERGPMGASGPPGPLGEKGQPGISVPNLTGSGSDCCKQLAKADVLGPNHEEREAQVGSDVTLPCTGSGYPPPSISWTPSPTSPSEQNRFTVADNGLHITTVSKGDGGYYTCTVSNIFGTQTKVVKLDITEPVTVKVQPPVTTLEVGQDVQLTCHFTGLPVPAISWAQRRSTGQISAVTSGVQTSGDTSVLTLPTVAVLDAGNYTCSATNSRETGEDSAEVVIHSKPVIIQSKPSIVASAGTNVTVECLAAGSTPINVTWKYPQTQGHRPLNVFEEADGAVIILVAVEEFNEGDYTCLAANAYGSATVTTHVEVIEPVTITSPITFTSLTDKAVVALDCHATGDPAPKVSWSKMGGQLNAAEPRYILLANGDFIITAPDSTTADIDAGAYLCLAENGVTNASKVDVVYKEISLTCNSTFADCSSQPGVACGGKCPAGCDKAGGTVYGSDVYATISPVCKSGIHAGATSSNGGLVVWGMIPSTGKPLKGTASNGINSLGSSPLHQLARVFIIPAARL